MDRWTGQNTHPISPTRLYPAKEPRVNCTMASRDEVVSPEAVDAMIANGDVIVIMEDYVLRLNSWLDKHPGGKLAILHMVGRDATDEITA